MTNITVYSIPGCGHCKDVKKFLKKEDIEFNDIDITDVANEKYIDDAIDGEDAIFPKTCKGEKGSENHVCVLGFDKEKLKELITNDKKKY